MADPTRIPPGAPGRADYLDDLNKPPLRAEVDIVDAELAAASAKGADPYEGLLPLVLHVGGVPWNGTERRLVRCAASGPGADLWLVQIGAKMVVRTTGTLIPFKPYRHMPTQLQSKIGWSLEDGLAHLRKK